MYHSPCLSAIYIIIHATEPQIPYDAMLSS
jgi:hypothetical protein